MSVAPPEGDSVRPPVEISVKVGRADLLSAYAATQKEYARLMREQRQPSPGAKPVGRLLVWFPAVFVIAVGLLLALNRGGVVGPIPGSVEWIFSWVGLFGFFAGYVFVWPLYCAWLLRRNRTRWLKLTCPNLDEDTSTDSIRLGANFVEVEGHERRSRWALSAFLSVVETTELFALLLKDAVVVLPKRFFAPDQMSAFRAVALAWNMPPRMIALRPSVPAPAAVLIGLALTAAGTWLQVNFDNYAVWARATPAPPATNYAALEDPSALPYLDEKGRQGYRDFLLKTKPRAFVIAPDGAWAYRSGGADPLAAALSRCREHNEGCQFYAVDDQVVWADMR